jgi:hypothetical protein
MSSAARTLGHEPKTTRAKHYVKRTAPMLAGVFPVLPKSLCEADVKCEIHTNDFNNLQCEGRDLNPYRSYPTGT